MAIVAALVAELRRRLLGISPEEIRYTFEDVRKELRATRAELKEEVEKLRQETERLRTEIGELPRNDDRVEGPETPVAEA
jgi:predicted  nucleic acid-binding Zn-ribbon protein